jgi:hypothetical protein
MQKVHVRTEMRKTIAVFSLVLWCALAVFAAEGKPVSYPSGNETVKGVLYAPAGAGPFPALVVVHE